MGKIKFEFLAQYYKANPVPLRSKVFADIARASRWFSGPAAPLVNSVMRLRPVKWGLERFLGISSRRSLPAFSRRPFSTRARMRNNGSGRKVVLFADTVNNYNHPDTLLAAYELLQAAGFDVLVHSRGCCGRPMISKGLHAQAAQAAREMVDTLHPFAEQGIPILGLEPSCLSALKDDYLALLPGDPRVRVVADSVIPVDEFLVREESEGRLGLRFQQIKGEILLHGHCHQKAIFGTEATRKMLSWTGAAVREVDSGCCGMAGSFGYEAEHYEISLEMGERRLFPAVRAHQGLTAAPGVSCRAQIADGTGVEARHPIQILRDALEH